MIYDQSMWCLQQQQGLIIKFWWASLGRQPALVDGLTPMHIWPTETELEREGEKGGTEGGRGQEAERDEVEAGQGMDLRGVWGRMGMYMIKIRCLNV